MYLIPQRQDISHGLFVEWRNKKNLLVQILFLNFSHTVITFDKALCSRTKEIVWRWQKELEKSLLVSELFIQQ